VQIEKASRASLIMSDCFVVRLSKLRLIFEYTLLDSTQSKYDT